MRKHIISIVFLAVCILIIPFCGKKTAENNIRFVTGGESGTYYAFGSVLAQQASTNTPYHFVGLVGSGSQGNVLEIQDDYAELGFCQSDVANYAYEGTNLFEKNGRVDNFSVVAALYLEQVQIITTNPNIKTVADLKGKRVSVGSSGSGVYFNALDVLGEYGISLDDIKATYQSFGDSANDLRDEKIDAAFIVAGAPTTAVVDLGTTKKVYLVSIEEEHMDNLIKRCPFYAKSIIPASVYKTEEDVSTVSVSAVVLARDSVSEDIIYSFTKDIFDNAKDRVNLHAKYGEISLELASSLALPYHKGSAKYFKEKGFDVNVK